MKSFVPTRAIPRGPRFVPNEVRQNDDGTTSIFLERKVGPRFTCTIDTSDYDTVQAYRWCANRSGHSKAYYAKTHVIKDCCRTTLFMHRLLLSDAKEIDHKSGDGLDNRRISLRSTSHSQNAANKPKNKGKSSRYLGVNWHKSTGKFEVRIQVQGKRIQLGYFLDEIDAAQAHDNAALKYFGEFAQLNFPPETATTSRAVAA